MGKIYNKNSYVSDVPVGNVATTSGVKYVSNVDVNPYASTFRRPYLVIAKDESSHYIAVKLSKQKKIVSEKNHKAVPIKASDYNNPIMPLNSIADLRDLYYLSNTDFVDSGFPIKDELVDKIRHYLMDLYTYYICDYNEELINDVFKEYMIDKYIKRGAIIKSRNHYEVLYVSDVNKNGYFCYLLTKEHSEEKEKVEINHIVYYVDVKKRVFIDRETPIYIINFTSPKEIYDYLYNKREEKIGNTRKLAKKLD